MKTKRHAARLRKFTVTAKRGDVEICRCVVMALNEDEALIEGSDELSSKRGAGPFEDTVTYGAENVDTARTYRSHHFVFDFVPCDPDEAVYADRRIELQIRSRLQHSWATAVEAVGLVRNDDMKAGEGDRDWLRFFEHVSSEFADSEGTALVPDAPSKRARMAELRSLDRKLGAIQKLESVNQAFQFTESNMGRGANYFMIEYDNVAKAVDVVGYVNPISGMDQYANAERRKTSITTVLVEVDKVENLREAYPNYFLDVRLFTQNVLSALNGGKMIQALHKQDVQRTAYGYDLAWLKQFVSDR